MAKDIITKAEILGGEIDVRANFGQTVKVTVSPDPYMGDTEVTPSDQTQVLATKKKFVQDDITVYPAPTETLSTTSNGTFTPSDGKVGFSQVTVDVNPDLRPLSVSENGTYEPDGFDGYSFVIVNNPAQWTTEGFISGTEPAGDIYLNNLNTRKNALFSGCTEITKVVAIRTRFRSEIFDGCTKLKEVFFQSQYSGGATFEGGFNGCTALTKAVFYSAGDHAFNRTFLNCHNLEKADLDVTNSKLDAGVFENCYKLTTLVLRHTDSVVPTTNKLGMMANTPFRGYQGQSGTIYVPQDLIETYKITGVWKTLYDGGYTTFFPIEGSPYEHYYVDGTPIA